MKSNCLPGELETTDNYCVKQGCPSGFEHDSSSGMCYPKCAPGYESTDGGSRCFKICPEGYLTKSTQCVKPKHSFKKDIVPCNGCIGPTLPIIEPETYIDNEPYPIMMNPIVGGPNYGFTGTSIIQRKVKGPSTHIHSTLADKRKISHSHDTTTTTTLPIGSMLFEYFNPSEGVTHVIEPSQINKIKVIEQMANQDNAKRQKKWTVEDSIYIDDAPCPNGYSLSGQYCKSNCPPNYRDTENDECVQDRYTIDRPSYDRGSGIPYQTKRSKYQNINPVTQCN